MSHLEGTDFKMSIILGGPPKIKVFKSETVSFRAWLRECMVIRYSWSTHGGQLASPLTFGGSRLHISCDRPLVEAKKKKR